MRHAPCFSCFSRFSRLLTALLLGSVGAMSCLPAAAQFAMVPAPLFGTPQASEAETDIAYRAEAAKHLYAAYPMRIFKGRMPPLLVYTDIWLVHKGGNFQLDTLTEGQN